ncbi:MAG: tautomerase family protein [archaeon]
MHRSLVEVFDIPDSDRTQRMYELKAENFEIPAGKTENIILIEITIFPGRSEKTKRALYREIVDNLVRRLNISEKEITIVLNEPALVNWGIKGGKSAADVGIGFNLKI